MAQARQQNWDAVADGATEAYRARITAEGGAAELRAVSESKDATFLQRSVDNDRATLTGVLTGGSSPQPVVVKLVKEGGAWKVDDVTLGSE
jgi:hypothetical protein